MAESRASRIKLLLFDVDGVLTDGTILFLPAPAGVSRSVIEERTKDVSPGFGISDTNMIETKGFNAHDGTGFSLARFGGLKTGIITKRISETVALRARDLKVDYLRQGIQDKQSVFEELLREEKITAEQAAYVGDDIIDLPVMRQCGLAIAVADARPEVRQQAHYVTEHRGGRGAARDAVEFILRAQGTWQRVLEDYLKAHSK